MISLIVLGIIVFFGLRLFFGLFGWLFRLIGLVIIGGLIFAFASSFIGIFVIITLVLLGSWTFGNLFS